MTIEKQVQVNRNIMGLILSKYNDSFPIGYNTPEAHYFKQLEKDIETANRFQQAQPTT